MTLFLKAVEGNSSLCEEIIKHLFNQEMMRGNLSPKIFSYYIEQDHLYLKKLKSCYETLASKAPAKYKENFSKYIDETIMFEQELHKMLEEDPNFNKTGFVTPATTGYSSYLLDTCANSSLEIGVASILPCFFVYQQIGRSYCRNPYSNNPYAKWIETYSSEDFSNSVAQAIKIFNELASEADKETCNKMLGAYKRSCQFELQFFDDAYHQRKLDSSELSPGQVVQNPDVIRLLHYR